MKLEIDTKSPLSDVDKRILLALFDDGQVTPASMYNGEFKSFNYSKEENHNSSSFEYPKVRNMLDRNILHCLAKYDRLMDIAELSSKIENTRDSIVNSLCKLVIAKKVGKTSSLPRSYFIYGNNSEIKEFIRMNPKLEVKV